MCVCVCTVVVNQAEEREKMGKGSENDSIMTGVL